MKTLVVLVGPQGSGKSTFCQNVLSEYCRISQDDMGRYKHWSEFLNALANGEQRIVLDKTNASKSDRHRYVKAARDAGYRLRAIYFDVPFDTCSRRLDKRTDHKYSKNEKRKSQVQIGLKTWFLRYEEPTLEEGFDCIYRIDDQDHWAVLAGSATKQICDECGYVVRDIEREDPSHPHMLREVDEEP